MNKNLYLSCDGKIETSDEALTYWSEKLKCDIKDLKNSINTVGEQYNIIVLFLELNRQIRKE